MEREVVTMDTRMVASAAVEAANDGGSRLSGYAVVFDALSDDLGGFRERIRRGAFSESLLRDDQRALWSHEKYVLGRRSAGTLRLWEDERGLKFECDLPDTNWARDLAESIRRGDIREMSFGFSVVGDEGEAWSVVDGEAVRDVLQARLYEISVVPFPAYPQTSVDVRSRANAALERAQQNSAALERGRVPPGGAQDERLAVRQSASDVLRMRLAILDKRNNHNRER